MDGGKLKLLGQGEVTGQSHGRLGSELSDDPGTDLGRGKPTSSRGQGAPGHAELTAQRLFGGDWPRHAHHAIRCTWPGSSATTVRMPDFGPWRKPPRCWVVAFTRTS